VSLVTRAHVLRPPGCDAVLRPERMRLNVAHSAVHENAEAVRWANAYDLVIPTRDIPQVARATEHRGGPGSRLVSAGATRQTPAGLESSPA